MAAIYDRNSLIMQNKMADTQLSGARKPSLPGIIFDRTVRYGGLGDIGNKKHYGIHHAKE